MGILNFSIRSQDIDFKDEVAGDTRQAKKTIKLEQGLKLRYLKLLHIYHNIDNTNITDGEGVSNNTVLFCKISFLNSKNSLFIESSGGSTVEHAGMLCLGTTIEDLYKVLHDGKQLLFINQPFEISLFKLTSKEPADANTNITTYNNTDSHKIEPLTIGEFRGGLDSPGQFLSMTFEYQEDESK